jgi:hypothetical protein
MRARHRLLDLEPAARASGQKNSPCAHPEKGCASIRGFASCRPTAVTLGKMTGEGSMVKSMEVQMIAALAPRLQLQTSRLAMVLSTSSLIPEVVHAPAACPPAQTIKK